MNMTLNEFCEVNKIVSHPHGEYGTRYIPDRQYPNQWDLSHLSDFIVSSVVAGTIWLIKREISQS
jgi:hypothetical protein